jgi:hypothetical protein
MPGGGRRRLTPLLLLGILATGAVAVVGADHLRRDYFTTADEPEHVRACRELRSGPGVVSNFEHPVLMKVLGAAGLPISPPERAVEEVREARRLFPFVFGLLVVVSGLWASLRLGAVAGLSVAALVAAEPTLRGHAPLVHTDLLLTALLVTAAACLDLSGPPRSPRRALLVLSGVVYGLALVAKYSALPFLAVFLGVALLRLRGEGGAPAGEPAREKGRKRRRRNASPALPGPSWSTAARRALLLVGVPAVATALLVQQAVVASTTSREAIDRAVRERFAPLPQYQGGVRAATALPRGLTAYAAGLLWVRASSVPGARINYFLGEAKGTGSLLYFPAALSLKLTTAVVAGLAAALAAVGVVLFRRSAPGRRRRLRLLRARGLLPFLLGAAYLAAAMTANVNIGVRHAAPSVPLFFVAAAAVLVTTLRGRRRAAILAAVVALSLLEAGVHLKREIPFGNLLAGGPQGVRRVLSDSNVDWGERLDAVFARASEEGLGRVGVVSLFWDEQAAREAGAVRIGEYVPGTVDSLFVSVFLWDLGPALERSRESGGKIAYFRGRLGLMMRTLRAEALSVEPFLDEYLLIRLRPVSPPAAPSR